jgi:hypothetical protein
MGCRHEICEFRRDFHPRIFELSPQCGGEMKTPADFMEFMVESIPGVKSIPGVNGSVGRSRLVIQDNYSVW